MSGPEFQKVESPLIAQLVRMGWKHTTGNLDHPSVTGRGSFREVLLLGELRAAITRINLRDGKPWLDLGPFVSVFLIHFNKAPGEVV